MVGGVGLPTWLARPGLAQSNHQLDNQQRMN